MIAIATLDLPQAKELQARLVLPYALLSDADGTLTVWLSQSIPGAQAKMELRLDTPQGEFVMSVDPVEIHEEK